MDGSTAGAAHGEDKVIGICQLSAGVWPAQQFFPFHVNIGRRFNAQPHLAAGELDGIIAAHDHLMKSLAPKKPTKDSK